MAHTIDMMPTYYRKAELPGGLYADPTFPLQEGTIQLQKAIESGTYKHSIILMSGLAPGKTVNAVELLKTWLKTRQSVVDTRLLGYFVPVRGLCWQNRCIDRYNRDEGLIATIRKAREADFLVLDGVFSYLTQNDDLLLQAIYDARQHSGKTTIVTTSIIDPLECAGSVLYRVARDANVRMVF